METWHYIEVVSAYVGDLFGMYQGSDFISDFRARRIRTQIAWENLSAIRDSFPGINSPGQAPVEHARGFSVSRTRLQWSFSGARPRLQWRCGAVCSSPGRRPTFSENPGKILGILEPVAKSGESPAGNSWNFASSDQSRPEKRRDLSHVTQPRARINARTKRGDRGLGGPPRRVLRRGCDGQRRTAKGDSWTRVRDRAGQRRHSPEIAYGIASLIHSACVSKKSQKIGR
jgi:hypothetical protein